MFPQSYKLNDQSLQCYMSFTYSTGTIMVQHWSICPISVLISIFCHGINQSLALITIHGQPVPHPHYCSAPTCWAITLETNDTSEGAPFNVVMWRELLLLSHNSSMSRFLCLFYFSIPYIYCLMFAGWFVTCCLFLVFSLFCCLFQQWGHLGISHLISMMKRTQIIVCPL